MKDNKNHKIMKRVIMVGIIIVVLGMFFVMFQNHVFSRPFEDFNGPEYVPEGFNATQNITTDNERIFEYSGNGTIYVGVIKNTNTNELNETLHFLDDDPEGVIKRNETLPVNGHSVTFQISEYNLNLHGMDLKSMLPEDSEISNVNVPGININMTKFQATWYCDKTNLTYVAEGLVTPGQLEEMKIMTQSVKCHQEKTIWDYFKSPF